MASRTTNRVSPEVRTRAVGLVFEHKMDHSSRRATVTSIAAKMVARRSPSMVGQEGGDRQRRAWRRSGRNRRTFEGGGASEPRTPPGE